MVEISMGINPTVISKHKFGDENLGGPIQFTSHIGLNFIFNHHYSMGCRLQHMSNGVLYEHNPGVNTYMIEVGYRF
jgi:lipid A 3-O-deacylase